jgi:hypothetical protein
MTKQFALTALLLALATCEPDALPAAELRTMPDPTLTPGAVETTDATAVCQPGYAKAHRHVSTALREHVFAAYGMPLFDGYRVELDHLAPLELTRFGLGGFIMAVGEPQVLDRHRRGPPTTTATARRLGDVPSARSDNWLKLRFLASCSRT